MREGPEAAFTDHPLLCVDCYYFVKGEQRCNNRESRRVNVVTGEVRLFHAATMRGPGPCGPTGKLWEAKP